MEQYTVEIEGEEINDGKGYRIRVIASTESTGRSVKDAIEMMRLAKVDLHALQHHLKLE